MITPQPPKQRHRIPGGVIVKIQSGRLRFFLSPGVPVPLLRDARH